MLAKMNHEKFPFSPGASLHIEFDGTRTGPDHVSNLSYWTINVKLCLFTASKLYFWKWRILVRIPGFFSREAGTQPTIGYSQVTIHNLDGPAAGSRHVADVMNYLAW
jgi:hypothetical protein